MRRRTYLYGLGSVSLGGSGLIGSGAFSRVETQRSADIRVAHDSQAYLGLQRTDSPNASYVDFDGKGHLRVRMSPDNPNQTDPDRGTGVNPDSHSWFHNVFRICNHGNQKVCTWIEKGGGQDTSSVTFYNSDEAEATYGDVSTWNITGTTRQVPLHVGDCVTVGIHVETIGFYGPEAGDVLLEDITVHADAKC